ncbi:MAG: outer membrane protein assembly factor BamD [Desulfamplus sp.]|nr:outer membrane protein assembly factor BamD [Desulfamplus sp.]
MWRGSGNLLYKFITVIIAILLMGFLAGGCAWFSNASDDVEKSALELADEGIRAYQDGNYKSAIKAFTTLRDWYPFSKYVILAELKIADSHYKLKAYEEAVAAYQEFESLHPRNETVPYVIYQIAMCWYKRVVSVDKDQTPTRKALEEFHRLMERFPDSRYSKKALDNIDQCMESLAGHEEYVARYYLKTKHYKAALKRFESIFANYPDTEAGKRALEQISLCKERMGTSDA